MKLEIDRERLTGELDALGAISQEPAPVVTRVVFTEADVEARAYVKKLCREAGSQYGKTRWATPSRVGAARIPTWHP
jgi:hypothetical protein